MELREPRKKKRVRLQPQQPLPLIYNENGELTIFTSHLTALGTCVINPDETDAIFSMGFFGKGSLSNNLPLFGKIYHGAPPIIRHRQWLQRKEWFDEVKKLSIDSLFEDETLNKSNSLNKEADIEMMCETENPETVSEKENITIVNKFKTEQDLIETVNISKKKADNEKSTENVELSASKKNVENTVNKTDKYLHNEKDNAESNIDEVVLDSTEDEDVCEIISKGSENDGFRENAPLLLDEEMDIIYSRDENEMNLQGKVLVLPDSDSETEDYLKDIKPKLENEGFPVRESLHLTFEETFFLMYAIGCLQVVDFDGKLLTIKETWDHFCKESKNFLPKYVVYHYFRSKGWVVKPSLKYGGDFLLYKDGPPFYHASYIVIIDLDTKIDEQSLHKMTWKNVFGLGRLTEVVAKELLVAQVLWPNSIPRDCDSMSPDILSQFTVRELLLRRWIPTKNKPFANSEEDDDEDSS